MGMLSDNFLKTVRRIGMDELSHPIFYHSPIGIRFEIGASEGVYLDDEDPDKYDADPAYLCAAFDRAKAIYTSLPQAPDVLRIDGWPDGSSVQKAVQWICEAAGLPRPHEQVEKHLKVGEEEDRMIQLQLYWDLEKMGFTPDHLLQEVIRADIGGYNGFASNVYFADTRHGVLFHLYDDRGADLVAGDKKIIRPLYEKFDRWILDYDRDKIDSLFKK